MLIFAAVIVFVLLYSDHGHKFILAISIAIFLYDWCIAQICFHKKFLKNKKKKSQKPVIVV